VQKTFSTGSIHIQDAYATLDSISNAIENKIPGAYLRFGDGDIELMEGEDDSYQKKNKLLAFEMREAFSLWGPGIFKCLPLHSKKYGMMPHMIPGIHEVNDIGAENILIRTYRYFIGHLIYSPVALSYVTAYDRVYSIAFYKFLKKQNLIFVGNEKADSDVLYKLFGIDTHIKSPSHSSFSQIDRITSELTRSLEAKKGNYTVVIIAMGCAGRVLQKRIVNKEFNCFLSDFGSTLDIFCGNKTRAWMEIDNTIDINHYPEILNKL
jgi:hypothetical protein